jgi:hypothetical protein
MRRFLPTDRSLRRLIRVAAAVGRSAGDVRSVGISGVLAVVRAAVPVADRPSEAHASRLVAHAEILLAAAVQKIAEAGPHLERVTGGLSEAHASRRLAEARANLLAARAALRLVAPVIAKAVLRLAAQRIVKVGVPPSEVRASPLAAPANHPSDRAGSVPFSRRVPRERGEKASMQNLNGGDRFAVSPRTVVAVAVAAANSSSRADPPHSADRNPAEIAISGVSRDSTQLCR